MQEIQLEAITLKSSPYQEKSKISLIFTKEFGLLPLFVKKEQMERHQTLTSPICRGEFLLIRKKNFSTLLDGKILDSYSNIRKSSMAIETALELSSTILKLQSFPEKALSLYKLLNSYLKHVDQLDKNSLISSFYLKILLFEGLFHTDNLSSFSEEEKELILELTLAKTFSQLSTFKITNELKDKIAQLYTTTWLF